MKRKEAKGIPTQLVTMHPRERDRLWGSHDVYRVTNPEYATSGGNMRQTEQYKKLQAERAAKVKADKEQRDWERQAAPPPPADDQWWSTDSWSASSSAWKKHRW